MLPVTVVDSGECRRGGYPKRDRLKLFLSPFTNINYKIYYKKE